MTPTPITSEDVKRLVEEQARAAIYVLNEVTYPKSTFEDDIKTLIPFINHCITTLQTQLEEARRERDSEHSELIRWMVQTSEWCEKHKAEKQELQQQLTTLSNRCREMEMALSPLSAWWAFTQAQYQLENHGEEIPRDLIVLSFMGSGASTNVTVGQLNKALSPTTNPTTKL